MVEQNANLALQIADYGYVLQTGRIALAGPARDLLRDAASAMPIWAAEPAPANCRASRRSVPHDRALSAAQSIRQGGRRSRCRVARRARSTFQPGARSAAGTAGESVAGAAPASRSWTDARRGNRRRRHGRARGGPGIATPGHHARRTLRSQPRRARGAVADVRAHGGAALAAGADRAGARLSEPDLPRLVRGAVRTRGMAATSPDTPYAVDGLPALVSPDGGDADRERLRGHGHRWRSGPCGADLADRRRRPPRRGAARHTGERPRRSRRRVRTRAVPRHSRRAVRAFERRDRLRRPCRQDGRRDRRRRLRGRQRGRGPRAWCEAGRNAGAAVRRAAHQPRHGHRQPGDVARLPSAAAGATLGDRAIHRRQRHSAAARLDAQVLAPREFLGHHRMRATVGIQRWRSRS